MMTLEITPGPLANYRGTSTFSHCPLNLPVFQWTRCTYLQNNYAEEENKTHDIVMIIPVSCTAILLYHNDYNSHRVSVTIIIDNSLTVYFITLAVTVWFDFVIIMEI